MKKPILIILVILILDQIFKFWIKTTMYLGQDIPVFGNWFILHFTENEGMAFGMTFGGEWGKLALSLFRIVAVIGIGWYMVVLSKTDHKPGLLYCMALIFAGATGNIIDSAFYGLIFTDSYARVAEFLPEGGGYASFLHGKVVDMLYFPVIQTTLPEGFPWKGGQEFVFFRPVFNLADASITTGVLWLIVFQKRYFPKKEEVSQPIPEDPSADPTEV